MTKKYQILFEFPSDVANLMARTQNLVTCSLKIFDPIFGGQGKTVKGKELVGKITECRISGCKNKDEEGSHKPDDLKTELTTNVTLDGR